MPDVVPSIVLSTNERSRSAKARRLQVSQRTGTESTVARFERMLSWLGAGRGRWLHADRCSDQHVRSEGRHGRRRLCSERRSRLTCGSAQIPVARWLMRDLDVHQCIGLMLGSGLAPVLGADDTLIDALDNTYAQKAGTKGTSGATGGCRGRPGT